MRILSFLTAIFLALPAPLLADVLPVVARSEAKLHGTSLAGAEYGHSVAIDGDTVVVGAPSDDGGAARSGAVYVYVRSGATWTQQAKLMASDADTFDQLGSSVAIDGDTIVAGAYVDDDGGNASGSAYVFVRSGSVWTEQAKLTASDAAEGDFFGQAVGLSGDTIIVGAFYDQDAGFASGSAYVFDRAGTIWTETTKLTPSDHEADDYFGYRVALEGDTALISSPENDDAGTQSGSAYVFVRSSGVWSEQAKLTASDASAETFFGASVGLSGDNAIIGGLGIGNLAPPVPAYVFVRSGTVWTEQAAILPAEQTSGSAFSGAVKISGDTAIVGAFAGQDGGIQSGVIHVFGRSGTAWTEQAKIVATDAGPDDVFGFSVALAGTTAIVGAPRFAGDPDAGDAYVYELSPGMNGGGKLSITNAPSDDPDKNKIRYRALASAMAPADPGSAGDPSCGAGNGGSIEVKSAASGEAFSQTLPCTHWSVIGKPTNPKGYRYKDPARSAGPCTRIVFKAGKLRMVCSGRVASPLDYDLQSGQSEAPVSVILQIGAETYCARFGGAIVKDGSNGKSFVAGDPATTTACE